MIDKNNIFTLLKEVDDQLVNLGESSSRLLIIYGGAALISMDIISRATIDIDVFDPKLDSVLEKAIQAIAKKYLLDEQWMNSTGSAFVKELPKGWKKRAKTIFRGKLLTVKTLGRIDLIFTKILAELDRGEDFEDLKNLNPTRCELESVREPLKFLESDAVWREKVDEIINALNGGRDE